MLCVICYVVLCYVMWYDVVVSNVVCTSVVWCVHSYVALYIQGSMCSVMMYCCMWDMLCCAVRVVFPSISSLSFLSASSYFLSLPLIFSHIVLSSTSNSIQYELSILLCSALDCHGSSVALCQTTRALLFCYSPSLLLCCKYKLSVSLLYICIYIYIFILLRTAVVCSSSRRQPAGSSNRSILLATTNHRCVPYFSMYVVVLWCSCSMYYELLCCLLFIYTELLSYYHDNIICIYIIYNNIII